MQPFSSTCFLRRTVTLFFVLWFPLANAILPGTMGYQAYLTDTTGAPINGEQSITFRLYTTETGGSMVWEESQRLTINQGLLHAQLGAVTPLNLPDDFDTPLYLGIAIETDAEMTPRRPLTLSGYAVQAANADTLDGQDAAALDQSAHVSDTANPHNVTATQVGAVDTQVLSDHAADASVHHPPYGDPDAVRAILAADGTGSGLDADTLDGQDSTMFATAAALAALQTTVANLQTTVNTLQASVTQLEAEKSALEAKLQYLTVTDTDMYITGANLHIRSGSGRTSEVNGLGNLIVGYDEPSSGNPSCSLGRYTNQDDCLSRDGVWAKSHKSGSHNVVLGTRNNYSSYAGLVSGLDNTISGGFALVTGGQHNTASGYTSSILGGGSALRGDGNEAYANNSVIVGGRRNMTGDPASANPNIGWCAVVSGGAFNTASGTESAVSGGAGNTASGSNASVSGGRWNVASGYASSVLGGGNSNAVDGNEAFADYSAIVGGRSNLTGDPAKTNNRIGENATVGGGQKNIASGDNSSVSGGDANTASGSDASVSGGNFNTASGTAASVSGGKSNSAEGLESSVSGGESNTAIGSQASISGGGANQATGNNASVSGGKNNLASGENAAVSGGDSNVASSTESTVSGGAENQAIANNSTVGGGARRSATGQNDWVAGALLQSD